MFPKWDMTLVLEALTRPIFEPLGSVGLTVLTYETVLLVVLTTVRRFRDIHALSVSPECMSFGWKQREVGFSDPIRCSFPETTCLYTDRVGNVPSAAVSLRGGPAAALFLSSEGAEVVCSADSDL